jgi:alkanesulfonate monooxygenase SsuD/methylene tetrahydromethanopterin reductase-like flavin-dependent oxidoreductase (luciferase family)
MGVPAVGTPDEVTEMLRQSRQAMPGTTGFMIGFRHPGMRTEDVRESMRLFAEHVMPNLD